MSPALAEVRQDLAALPDDAAHALDPEPGPPQHDLPPDVPPPPPFILPLPEPQATAPGPGEGAGLNPVPAPGPAPGFEPPPLPPAAEGTAVATVPWWVPPGAEAETPFVLPELALPAPPPVPGAGHVVPLAAPAPPALPADVAEPAAGVFGPEVSPVLGPADVAAPGALPIPVPGAADPGSGGTTPPWWDPFLGAVVGAAPEPRTPPWWDPLLGQVVEPGAGGRPRAAPAEAASEETYARPPGDESESPFGGLLEPLARLPAAAGRAFGSLLGRGGAAGRDVAELLGAGGEGDTGGEEEVPFAPLTTPPGAGFGEGGGGGGDLVGLLTRIAEGVERLIEAVGQAQEAGGASFGGRPGRPTPGGDFGYDDDPETPASPSVDLWDLFRPGKTQDAAARPDPEAPKRQRRAAPEEV